MQYHERQRPAPARRGFRSGRSGLRCRRSPAESGPFSKHLAKTERSSRRPCAVSTSTRPFVCSRTAGVATKIEANGKIFPVSDKAAQVLDALVQRVERSGAELRCSAPVLSIDRLEGEPGPHHGFAVTLADETITARRVIVAVGGCSYPGCGTTGDGYSIAQTVRPHDRRAAARACSPAG